MGEEGGVQRAAGVQHRRVGLVRVVRHLGTVLAQLTHHLLAALCDFHCTMLYAGVRLHTTVTLLCSED